MGHNVIYSTIEEELARKGRGFFQTVGDSMEPMLHNRRSTVVVEKFTGMLKRHDVALYRRPSGKYVLHRVVKVLHDGYVICGDNRTYREFVPREWVIGVMTGFYPDEGEAFVSCEDEKYQRYLRTLGMRYGIRRLQALLKRIGGKSV